METLEDLMQRGEMLVGIREASITTVAELDHLINLGPRVRYTLDALSPEMQDLSSTYQTATKSMKQGDFHEALDIYERIVSNWPSFVAVRVNVAECLCAVGKPDQALEHLKHAHQFAPNDPDIHVGAGRAFEMIGDKQKELEEYHEALRDDPTNIGAMVNLGITYREVGKIQESKKRLRQALTQIEHQENQIGRQHPDKPKVLFNLAEAYEAEKSWRRAVEYYEQSLSLARGNPEVRSRLEGARRNARDIQSKTRAFQFWKR